MDQELKAALDSIHTKIADVQSQITSEIAGVRSEIADVRLGMTSEIAGVRSEIADLRSEMILRFEGTEVSFQAVRAQLGTMEFAILTIAQKLLADAEVNEIRAKMRRVS